MNLLLLMSDAILNVHADCCLWLMHVTWRCLFCLILWVYLGEFYIMLNINGSYLLYISNPVRIGVACI